jgi:hypothetical protein
MRGVLTLVTACFLALNGATSEVSRSAPLVSAR